jgi:hypothetical protein
MEDLGWTRRRGSSPVARRGRAAARGLDARIRFQHPFMPAGDTSHPNQINPIKNPLDSEDGIYRDHWAAASGASCLPFSRSLPIARC